MRKFKYKYDDLFNPLLQSLHNLGGSVSISVVTIKLSKFQG